MGRRRERKFGEGRYLSIRGAGKMSGDARGATRGQKASDSRGTSQGGVTLSRISHLFGAKLIASGQESQEHIRVRVKVCSRSFAFDFDSCAKSSHFAFIIARRFFSVLVYADLELNV